MSSNDGSAQQYQASVMYGTFREADRGWSVRPPFVTARMASNVSLREAPTLAPTSAITEA
jgi:hypothetical protein